MKTDRVARRGRRPSVVLVSVAVVAVIAVLVTIVVTTSGSESSSRSSDVGRESDAAALDTLGSARSSGAVDSDGRSKDVAVSASRVAVADPLLAPLDHETIRRLEQRGRAAFWGLVLDPSGAPCEGASIFHAGRLATTTDANGAWSIEVDHDVELVRRGTGFSQVQLPPLLAARKEGVGVRCVELVGPSRRIDLVLVPGERMHGTCLVRSTTRTAPDVTIDVECEPDLERAYSVAFTASTKADGRGDFTVGELLPGCFDLRPHGHGVDLSGFAGFNLLHDHAYTLIVDETIHVRGSFRPWPPTGAPPKATLALHASTKSRNGEGFDDRGFGGPVAADGSFDLEMPPCDAIAVWLTVDDVEVWRQVVRREEELTTIELGSLDLVGTGRAHGRVDLPRELLELGVEVRACGTDWSNVTAKRTVGRDGTFVFDVLTPPVAHFDAWLRTEQLGGFHPKAGEGGESIDGFTNSYFRFGPGDDVVVEQLSRGGRIGELQLPQVLLAGTVADDSGAPVGSARLLFVEQADPRATSGAMSARDGCYSVTVGRWRGFDASGQPIVRTGSLAYDVRVGARGFAEQHFPLEIADGVTDLRHDFQLSRRGTRRGRALDETGEPLVGWLVVASASNRVLAQTVSGGDGSFEIAGLPNTALEFTLWSPPRDQHFAFAVADRAGTSDTEPLVLSLADADKPEAAAKNEDGREP